MFSWKMAPHQCSVTMDPDSLVFGRRWASIHWWLVGKYSIQCHSMGKKDPICWCSVTKRFHLLTVSEYFVRTLYDAGLHIKRSYHKLLPKQGAFTFTSSTAGSKKCCHPF